MRTNNYEIKLQLCNLCDALHRNITDNFCSVSFEIGDNEDIQVKIILKNLTEEDNEYIDDISVEFSAFQTSDNVKPFIIKTIREDNKPLKNIVYLKKEN